MYPYWLLFGLFALGAFLAREDVRKDKPLGALFVGGLILVIMIGLRWRVGADWGAYEIWWDVARPRPLDAFLRRTGADPGFYILMWVFQHLGATFWMFNFAVAAIFTYGLVQFARAQVNPWLAVAVAIPYLVIVVAMSGIRQATAIGFVFLALLAFQRAQGWRFLFWMALAASFHASAILVLPLTGLSFAQNRFQSIVLLAIIAIGAFYGLGGTLERYSDRYLSSIVVQSSGTLFRIGMSVVPAILYFVFRKYLPAEAHERSLWRNLSIAALLTIPIYFMIASTTALDRLVLYLFPLQIYVLSWIPAVFRDAATKFATSTAILIYLGLQLFLFLHFGVNKDPYIPYRMVPFVS